jgi:hypothetical protein
MDRRVVSNDPCLKSGDFDCPGEQGDVTALNLKGGISDGALSTVDFGIASA